MYGMIYILILALNTLYKTCENVFRDALEIKCLPRAGAAHLFEAAMMTHLCVDADGFCGEPSSGCAAAGKETY